MLSLKTDIESKNLMTIQKPEFASLLKTCFPLLKLQVLKLNMK